MKRIIDGVSYDTETATEIATGSHCHELSDAWWTLYRTEHGAFFEVVADHDGRVVQFNPMTQHEARRFVEVNANDQVEKHFGPMQPPRPLPFSRKTIVAASKVMARMTHGDLTEFVVELGPEYQDAIPPEGVSLQKRLIAFVTLLDRAPHKKIDGGDFLQDVFVRKGVSLIRRSHFPVEYNTIEQALIQSLAVDGYTYADGTIRRTLPVDAGVQEAEIEIDRLLQKHGFAVSKEHLRQATNAHARGDWAAANSQLRTFVESLFDEIAVAVDGTAAALPSGKARRQRLASLGFFIRDLNEWQDNGGGFINGLMRRLHPPTACSTS